MGKGLKNRMAAAALSAAMAFTAVFAMDGIPVARAASKSTPYVRLRTSYKTLNVGQATKMTLKNNQIGWRITKIATEDRSIAMVYGKSASDFMIKGKAVGKTKIKARLATSARKQYNSKLVKCTVNVITQNQEVPEQPTVTGTKKIVATQAELDAALADKNLAEVTIDTKEKQNFMIQPGDYSNVALIVKAPASEVQNSATFQSIDVLEIAGDTWHENAAGNTLRITASSARIVVGPGGRIRDISFMGTQAKAKLVVNGTVDHVTVGAKMSLDISSDLAQKPMVPLTVDAAAKGAEVTTQIPLDASVKAVDTVLNFQKGSEGSKVKAEVKMAVKNNSDGSIAVTDAKNHTQNVQPGGKMDFNPDVQSYTPPTTNRPSAPVVTDTYYKVSFDGKEIKVRSGEKVKESDIPVIVKRNGDGYKFSGWYYADGKDEKGNIKYSKFDFQTAITKNIELVARFGMTEADRILDVRGKLTVTSGQAITIDLLHSHITVATGDEEETQAQFVNINGQAISDGQKELEVKPKDGKLEVIAQLKNFYTLYRAEVPLPSDTGTSRAIDLAGYSWSTYRGKSARVSSQAELEEALADRSCTEVMVNTPGALKLTISEEKSRKDVWIYVQTANAEIENYAVFREISIGGKGGNVWTEHAKGNKIYVVSGTSSIIAAEDAQMDNVIFNWGGDGSLTVNGSVRQINAWNNRDPEDNKEIKIEISGSTAANIPLSLARRDTTVTTSIPLDVIVRQTAPRCTVNFMEGSGNSTFAADVEAVVNNNSGQEIIFKETRK